VRLLTELDRGAQVVLPEDLKARPEDNYLKTVWNGQLSQFESRRAAIEGQRSVIREKINQLGSQIIGGEAQVKAYTGQITSVQAEAENIKPLVERGLIARPRSLQLERTAFGLEGQIADANANIAKARQAIAEQQQQIAQLDNDRMADITKDLRDTQAKMLEVILKAMNAKAALGRMEIRAPYTGRVVALSVFSVGGVIQRGEKILDIVPDQDPSPSRRRSRSRTSAIFARRCAPKFTLPHTSSASSRSSMAISFKFQPTAWSIPRPTILITWPLFALTSRSSPRCRTSSSIRACRRLSWSRPSNGLPSNISLAR
jgi:hypothetical protein